MQGGQSARCVAGRLHSQIDLFDADSIDSAITQALGAIRTTQNDP